MMEEIVTVVTGLAVEVITVIIGMLGIMLLSKIRSYVEVLKRKDETGLVDIITDRAVEYAEAELTGGSGTQKRNFAVARAIEILESKGIFVHEEEVIAGIENGVTKLHKHYPQNVLFTDPSVVPDTLTDL